MRVISQAAVVLARLELRLGVGNPTIVPATGTNGDGWRSSLPMQVPDNTTSICNGRDQFQLSPSHSFQAWIATTAAGLVSESFMLATTLAGALPNQFKSSIPSIVCPEVRNYINIL